ncbi:Ig-like domain-containing protein, partial [Lutibacter flavus]
TVKDANNCETTVDVTIGQPAALERPIASLVSQPTCISVTGSFSITNYDANYTYTISPSTGVSELAGIVTAPVGTYTITASNVDGCVSDTSLSVVMNPQPNCPPVADSNAITVSEDSTDTSLGLTAPTDEEDTAADLGVTVTGIPTLGEVTLADGTAVTAGMTLTPAQLVGLVYDAPTDYNGTDAVGTFTYTVTDSGLLTDETGVVTIAINAVNEPPVADSNAITVSEDSTDTSLGLTAPTDEEDTAADLGVTVTGIPTLGEVTLADGTAVTAGMTLTPAQLVGLVYDAPTDYNGTDAVGTFTYTVTDSGLLTDETGVVTIAIKTVNEPPVADDDTASTDEDTPVIINVLDGDIDLDGTIDSESVTEVTAPTNGSISIDPDTGLITYTPNDDFFGEDTFVYSVCDDDGACDTATVVVTVVPTLDVTNDVATTDEDESVIIPVFDNDNDIPNEGTITVTDPANGTVTVDDNGTPTDPSDDEVTYTPDSNFNGEDAFDYTICNAAGNCDTATVVVTVVPTLDLTNDVVTTDEDVPVIIPIFDNDNDIPTESTLTVTDPANGTVIVDDNGTLADLSDDIVTYTPNDGFTGEDTFEYTVCDSVGKCQSATVVITIDTSIDTIDDAATTDEDVSIIIPVFDNDNDIPTEGTITVTNPANGTVTVEDNGTPTDPSDDIVTYTPAEDFSGDDTFEYTVCDAAGNCDTATVKLTVTTAEFPDVVDDIIEVVESMELDIFGNDVTIPIIGTITVTQPEDGTITVDDNDTPNNPSDDILVFTPNEGFVGETSFEYTICNSGGDCDTASVILVYVGVLSECELSFPGQKDSNFNGYGFSPNGDGFNDYFIIDNLVFCYPDFDIQIFNRWGNVIFEYTHNGNAESEPIWWDGKSTGRMTINKEEVLPAGTYFYIINLNRDSHKPVSGYIYLTK